MDGERQPWAVILGGHLNALGAARSLGLHGVPVAVVKTHPADLAHVSRYCTRAFTRMDARDHPEVLLEFLDAHRSDWPGAVIFPTSDETVRMLADEFETVKAWGYHPALPGSAAARILLDKEETYRVASEVGIAVPRDFGPAQLDAVPDDLPYPVLVKPNFSPDFMQRIGVKLLVARDRDELGRRLAQIRDRTGPARLIEYIPGPDSSILNVMFHRARSGQAVGRMGRNRLRSSPPGFGLTRASRSVPVPDELIESMQQMLERIQWHGLAMAEFKQDARDGRWVLIEFNARLVQTNWFNTCMGVNFPWIWYLDLLERPLPDSVEARLGPVWINVADDLLALPFERPLEPYRLPEIFRSYLDLRVCAAASWRDPLPGVHSLARRVVKALRAGGRTRLRSAGKGE